jgi:penicillin-binding protein 2
MEQVVHGARGTARKVGDTAVYRIAGKSGTAQVVAIKQGEKYDRNKLQERHRDHALFVAFAPHDAPRYAIALIIQHAPSGGSADAAPRAREVMKVALLKDPEMRARIERPLPPEPTGPISEDEANFGAAPEAPVEETAPRARPSPTASTGPRPYLSEPR